MAKKPAKVDEEGLTVDEARFVDEYLIDLSPKHAALRIGIKEPSASSWAAAHMYKPDVKTAIEYRIAKRRAKMQRTRDRLMQEMENISFSRAKDYTVDPFSGVVSLDGVPVEDQDAAHACIKSVTHEVRYEQNPLDPNGARLPVYKTKIELWDKNTAHRNLGQHLGMFIERTAVSTDGDSPDGELTVWDFGGKKIKF